MSGRSFSSKRKANSARDYLSESKTVKKRKLSVPGSTLTAKRFDNLLMDPSLSNMKVVTESAAVRLEGPVKSENDKKNYRFGEYI